nr:4a-hydroxytetrahydrobiopterin dehydratase [Anaerolineae bacterium]
MTGIRRRQTMAYSADQIKSKLAEHHGWTHGEDGKLHKEFTFKNFSRALLFVNAVGFHAEQIDHHPDISIHSYKHVTISMKSHDADAITDRDFRLVERIESIRI